MIRSPLVIVLLAVALGCGASIDPQRKSTIDQKLAGITAKDSAYPRPFSPRVLFNPKPGHWARYKMVDKDGNPSFVTYKLIGRDGNVLDFETDMDSYFDHSIHRIKVEFDASWQPKQFLSYRMKRNDDKVVEYDGATLALMNQMMKQYLPMVTLSYEGWPQEDVKVVAGTFPGAFRGQQTVSFGPWSSESDIWQHPIVPLSGLVKSTSKDGTSMELIDFATEGAQSLL